MKKENRFWEKVALLLTVCFIITSALLVFPSPAQAYEIRNIYFVWNDESNGTVRMYFDVTGYAWGITERLSPNPEQFGPWEFGNLNGTTWRRMVTDYNSIPNAVMRVCLGVADSDPGDGAILYEHDNNRCFRIWLDPQSPPTVHAVEIFNISGRATDNGGSPISNVNISDGAGHTVSTDGNGDYNFRLLDTGSYTLTPSKSGYTFSPSSRSVSGGPPYNVRGRNFTGSNLSSISGKVVDSGGGPISGVTISDGAGHTTSTDGNGNYTLSGLSVGTYTLTPSKSGYNFSPDSRSVSVPPSRTGQDFTVTNRFSISGRVTDEHGNAVAGVPIACIGLTWNTTVTTNGSGDYVCSGLGIGVYRIKAPSDSSYTLSPPSSSLSERRLPSKGDLR